MTKRKCRAIINKIMSNRWNRMTISDDCESWACEIMDKNYPRSNGSYLDLISFVADRKGHDRRYAVNASKIRSKLGWKPTVSIKQGLKITVDWYVNNKEWWMPIQISNDSSKKKIN